MKDELGQGKSYQLVILQQPCRFTLIKLVISPPEEFFFRIRIASQNDFEIFSHSHRFASPISSGYRF
jgi:hypothetical protein